MLAQDTTPSETYTLSLHDALPISSMQRPTEDAGDTIFALLSVLSPGREGDLALPLAADPLRSVRASQPDRKSTRLNSSHLGISYAVFCLKKKKKQEQMKKRTIATQ